MSNYHEYREVKVMIANRLMAIDGWKVYGYKIDESDAMTDYYNPANWGGVAEKNGYVLCVNVYGASKPQEIREYKTSAISYDKNTFEKIAKLEQMTVARGASEAEEKSAKVKIQKLQKKAEQNAETNNKYIVTGVIPGHMENPPHCNWHIEKDGIIIAKGNGLLKYNKITSYFTYESYKKDLASFRKNADKWEEEYADELFNRGYYSNEKSKEIASDRRKTMMETVRVVDDFNKFINKLDTTCGGLLGEGNRVIYEKVKVTEYKKEFKPVETKNGEIKEGQLFILKTSFNYGCYKGLVYRIHATEYDGKVSYCAYKLNGKYTKECTGHATPNNRWYIGSGAHDNLTKWIERGAIAWCELQEVNTPYEMEKVVKKVVKDEKKEKKAESNATKNESNVTENSVKKPKKQGYEYEIEKSEHTKTHETLWLVKVKTKLSKEEFAELKRKFATLKGYYSTFTHSFIFKYNPTEKIMV